MKTYTVYALTCPFTFEARYIGMTGDLIKRIKQHIGIAKRNLVNQTYRIRLVDVIAITKDQDEARQIEIEMIQGLDGLYNVYNNANISGIGPEARLHFVQNVLTEAMNGWIICTV